jgi:transcriptional regulator with XRE-family HTH domain
MQEEGFATKLAAAMKAAGVGPEGLSRATGRAISPRTIARWLAGETEPGIGALRVLCPVLDVSSDSLLGLR